MTQIRRDAAYEQLCYLEHCTAHIIIPSATLVAVCRGDDSFCSWPVQHHKSCQALVYDILPSTTAVFSYAIGSRKLSANEQFFVGAQTVVSLLQTTQIIAHVCFITDHVAYASSNKTKIVWIETELFFFFLPGVDAPHVYMRAWALGCFTCCSISGCFHSLIGTRNFRRALTASEDSCAEMKSAPFSGVTKSGRVWRNFAGMWCSERGQVLLFFSIERRTWRRDVNSYKRLLHVIWGLVLTQIIRTCGADCSLNIENQLFHAVCRLKTSTAFPVGPEPLPVLSQFFFVRYCACPPPPPAPPPPPPPTHTHTLQPLLAIVFPLHFTGRVLWSWRMLTACDWLSYRCTWRSVSSSFCSPIELVLCGKHCVEAS